jgi:hypothetical protein
LTIAAMNLIQAVSPLLIRLGRSRASRLHATRRLVSNLDLERQCGLLAAKYLDRALVRRDAISERRIAIVERRLGLLLPEALRAYYRVAGRAAALNTAHNQLLYPEDLGVEDNHLMFMDENQSVVSWASGSPISRRQIRWSGSATTRRRSSGIPRGRASLASWRACSGGTEAQGFGIDDARGALPCRSSWVPAAVNERPRVRPREERGDVAHEIGGGGHAVT